MRITKKIITLILSATVIINTNAVSLATYHYDSIPFDVVDTQLDSDDIYTTNFQNQANIELNTEFNTPSKFDGVDLFRSNFNENNMTALEKEYFEFLIQKEANNYLIHNNTNETLEEISNDLKQIISQGTNLEKNTILRTAPWWHLNTVGKVGSAINLVISAALTSIGGNIVSGGIRALIAKVGKAQAKKIVKNVVVSRVKNTLIAWGMSKYASKVANALLNLIMWAADPGASIAKLIDKYDAKPRNGYIEAW